MHLTKVIFHPEKYPTADYYPFNVPALRQTTGLVLPTPVTLLYGDNGTGKSTLLKAMCHRCGIHIWEDTERARFKFNPFEDELYKYIDVEWVDGAVPGALFASQIFQDFARFLDENARANPGILDYFGGSSLMTQSHGESFISYFAARYKVKGIYFMDEPETALSPASQLKLLKVLKSASEAGHAQFVIATHSPILLACPGATIYSLNSVPIKTIGYEDTDCFRIYKDFLNDRSKYLESL